jgi:hypothetical protein
MHLKLNIIKNVLHMSIKIGSRSKVSKLPNVGLLLEKSVDILQLDVGSLK